MLMIAMAIDKLKNCIYCKKCNKRVFERLASEAIDILKSIINQNFDVVKLELFAFPYG